MDEKRNAAIGVLVSYLRSQAKEERMNLLEATYGAKNLWAASTHILNWLRRQAQGSFGPLRCGSDEEWYPVLSALLGVHGILSEVLQISDEEVSFLPSMTDVEKKSIVSFVSANYKTRVSFFLEDRR